MKSGMYIKQFLSIFLPLVFAGNVLADDIVVFGASGAIGSKMVREALDRGHTVYGVSRSPERFEYTEENFIGVAGNPTDAESVKKLAANADAIINAVGGREATDPKETAMNQSAIAFSKALSELGEDAPHLVTIGGGMTMLGSREKMIENMPPNAPAGSAFRALFLGHWEAYQTYLASDINWTFLAPPMNILGWRPGTGEDQRTGEYRVAVDDYVRDEEGKNQITVSDLAAAALDMAESGEYNQMKVTVGY